MNTSIFDTSVPKLLPSKKRSVRTAPSFGENPEKSTGLEGSGGVTLLGPSYPPCWLHPVAVMVITMKMTNNHAKKLLIFLSISDIIRLLKNN
jgi:hypothetical protein